MHYMPPATRYDLRELNSAFTHSITTRVLRRTCSLRLVQNRKCSNGESSLRQSFLKYQHIKPQPLTLSLYEYIENTNTCSFSSSLSFIYPQGFNCYKYFPDTNTVDTIIYTHSTLFQVTQILFIWPSYFQNTPRSMKAEQFINEE